MRLLNLSAVVLLVVLLCLGSAAGQLSEPHAHDSQADTAGNKFLQRQATEDKHAADPGRANHLTRALSALIASQTAALCKAVCTVMCSTLM